MNEQFDTPILFLIFNRLDTTAKVFEVIKKIKPTKLFLASDGPRNEAERDLVKKVRLTVESGVNWPCEVKILYREKNLGCKKAVSQAIDWFFSQVEEGIILEDDCLPNQSFFRFVQELLAVYRDDNRIMQISGSNFQMGNKRGEASYYFSVFNHIWGWATWRRAWLMFDLNMNKFPNFKSNNSINQIFNSKSERLYWLNIMEEMYDNKINTWDYAWTFACWQNNGLTCLPNRNLVTNIGFNAQATHGIYHQKNVANVPLSSMDFPLVHPLTVVRDKRADHFTNLHHYHISLLSYHLKKWLKWFGLYGIIKSLAIKFRG